MGNGVSILEAIGDLEQLLRQSATVPDAEFNDRRREEIQFRRRIAEQNSRIAALGEEIFARSGKIDDFHKELGKLRHAIALHLGSWPVVLIKLDDTQYKASVKRSRDAYEEFFSWVRRNV